MCTITFPITHHTAYKGVLYLQWKVIEKTPSANSDSSKLQSSLDSHEDAAKKKNKREQREQSLQSGVQLYRRPLALLAFSSKWLLPS